MLVSRSMPKQGERFVPHTRLKGNFHPHMPHFRHSEPEKEKTTDKEDEAPRVLMPYETAENQMRILEARAILGNNFFGPQEVRNTFGVELLPNHTPLLNTDSNKLKRAKADNLFLNLRIDTFSDGSPITIESIEDILQPVFTARQAGRVIAVGSSYPTKNFFTHDRPRAGWFFTSKDTIQGTDHRSYLDQSHVIGDFLEGGVFAGMKAPFTGIDYLKLVHRELQDLATTDPEQYVVRLSYLGFNQASRPTPVEAVYDLVAYYLNRGERLLAVKSSLTGGKNYFTTSNDDFAGDNEFIGVGEFTPRGIKITHHKADDASKNVGAAIAFKA